jgi:hypothetical protein
MTTTVSTVETPAAAPVASAQKLTSSQRSGLRRVVLNDFKAQKVQVKREAEAAVQRLHAERETAARERRNQQDKYTQEIKALVDTILPQVNEVLDRAKAEGSLHQAHPDDVLTVRLYFQRNGEEEQRTLAKIKSAEKQALLALEAAQNEVERGLLLASLTEEAQAALDSVPKAADLFAAAYRA